MLVSLHYLKDCCVRLSNMQKLLEKHKEDEIDIETIKTNFYGIIFEMGNAASESLLCLSSDYYYMFSNMISDIKKALVEIPEASKEAFIETIGKILKEIDSEEYIYETSEYSLSPNFKSDYSQGLAQINQGFLKEIALKIQSANKNGRPLNIIDTYGRSGINASVFKDNISNSRTYGVELYYGITKEYKDKFNRVATGAIKGSNISNDAFDILLMQPNISLSKGNDHLLTKKEKELLNRSMSYLRVGGTMVLILPHFRLYKDICYIIARNFTDIQIRKFRSGNLARNGLICVIATKKKAKELDQDGYTNLRYGFDIDSIDDIESLPLNDIAIMPSEIEIKLFRGSVLDPDEIDRLYKSSSCVSQFWKSQKVEKISENTKNPLLPFNSGQLGLVLCSGCLDGIVDEGDGNCHVVKGRVVKKITNDSSMDSQSNTIEITETTSNRVEINLFLPDGTYKVLA